MVCEKTVQLYKKVGQIKKWEDRPDYFSYFLAATAIVVAMVSASVQITQEIPGSYAFASSQSNENVTITVIFNQFNTKGAGKSLVDSAADILRSNHLIA